MTFKSRRASGVLRRHVRSAGVLRVVQPRAEATRDALLGTGRRLLNERDFEAMSIADLAAANGLSVGSFYGRFRDKEAYFSLLQEMVTTEWTELTLREFDTRRLAGWSAGKIVGHVAAQVVGVYRADRGFIRAALRHASNHPNAWTPLQRVGVRFATRVTELLAPRLTHLPQMGRAARVRFAMQLLYGMLVNAVINDPGPLSLDDPRLEKELAHAISAYLGLRPQ